MPETPESAAAAAQNELHRALQALRLEVPKEVADDFERIVGNALQHVAAPPPEIGADAETIAILVHRLSGRAISMEDATTVAARAIAEARVRLRAEGADTRVVATLRFTDPDDAFAVAELLVREAQTGTEFDGVLKAAAKTIEDAARPPKPGPPPDPETFGGRPGRHG